MVYRGGFEAPRATRGDRVTAGPFGRYRATAIDPLLSHGDGCFRGIEDEAGGPGVMFRTGRS
jgi:hypothetical protein